MNILVISHYAGSPAHGMAFRPYYLAKEWVRLGHSVRIVAASFSHLRYKQPSVDGSITFEDIDGIQYCWLKVPPYRGNGIGRVWNILVFLTSLFQHRVAVLVDFVPSVIIASSTYPFDNVVAQHLAKAHSAIHVFELHDLWPLSLIQLGGMPPWHPFVRLVGWSERHTYRTVDLVVSILPKAEPHMISLGLEPGSFVHIPNGVEENELRPEPVLLPEMHRAVFDHLRKRGQLSVGYVGGHAVSNALGNLIQASTYLEGEPVSVVLVGDGAEKLNLHRLAEELNLTNVHFLPPVPKNMVQSLLTEFDVLYIGWQRKPIYRFGVSPNKLVDYMLSARPIIHANEVGNDLVAESGCGISIAPEDPYLLAKTIVTISGMSKEDRLKIGRRGRDFVLKNLRYSDLAFAYLLALHKHGNASAH